MSNPKATVKHHGDHHSLELTADTRTGKIRGGAVYNFSDHAAARLNVARGKLSGSLIHSGDTHLLTLDLDPDGSVNGSYRELQDDGVELDIRAGVAHIRGDKRKLKGSLKFEGDHHGLNLKLDESGRLSGSFRSRLTGEGSVSLRLSEGKVSGKFTHKGKHHKTSVELSPNGWKSDISVRKGRTTFSLEVDGGKDLKVTSGQLSLGAQL